MADKKTTPVKKKASVTMNDYCLEILPYPHRTMEWVGEGFFISVKKISDVKHREGAFFVTSPEIRKNLNAKKARPYNLGGIRVEIKGKYIEVKDYHPIGHAPPRLLEGTAAASLADAAIEKYLKKKYPKHRILEPEAAPLRVDQLGKRGRNALHELFTAKPGIPIEKAHKKTKKYLLKRRREKQGKSRIGVKLATKAGALLNWGKRFACRKRR